MTSLQSFHKWSAVLSMPSTVAGLEIFDLEAGDPCHLQNLAVATKQLSTAVCVNSLVQVHPEH
jgi:hypothetical protein